MKNKKAQAQIIVTVLIILIVLAVIAIVATFVTRTVREGTEAAEQKAACIDVNLFIKEALNGEAVSIERSTGGPEAIDINVYVDGDLDATVPITNVTELETVDGPTATTGQEIQVAAVVDGELCDFSDSFTVL